MTEQEMQQFKQHGPEIDEETAVALAILINNHITVMKMWERKLRAPFVPELNRWFHSPVYPKPTLATVLQLMVETSKMKLEVLHVSNRFLEKLNATKEKQ
jgi:hypothetical protein